MGLFAFLQSVISQGLVPSVLVAVESVVLVGTWASLGTDGMSEAVEISLALLVNKSWSSGFTVSGSVNSLASLHGSSVRRVALLDGSLGLGVEGEVALDQGSKGGVLGGLKESLIVNDLGIGLIGYSNLGLISGIVSDVSIISTDLAETFGYFRSRSLCSYKTN